MEFRGRLKAPGDPGEGIAVELRLTDVFLELGSEAEELGRWRLDEVAIERVAGDLFDLTLEGESVVFVAADALSFAYEGVGYADEIRAKLKKRRRRKKRQPSESLLERLQESPEAPPSEPEPPAPEPTVPVPPRVELPSPSAPLVEDGVPVVVEAPAVSYVDTMSTIIAEVPDEPLPEIGAETPEPSVDAPEEIAEVPGDADDAEGSANGSSKWRLLDRLGRKPDDHEHGYGDARRTGVITRRVCQVCGHVTFDSERAYRGW